MKKPELIDCIQNIHYYLVQFVEKELRGFKLKQLKYSHYEIIRLLHLNNKMRLKDISQSIAKHKSTVTALIKKLEKLELIELTPSKRDARVTFVSLSKEGKKMKGLINSIEQKLLINLHMQLSKPEQDKLIGSLKKLLPTNS